MEEFKLTQGQEKFVLESLKWAKENPDAVIFDVPENLFQGWRDLTYQDGGEIDPVSFLIFMQFYGWTKTDHGRSTTATVSEDEITEAYNLWQIKLSIRGVAANTDLGCDPFPLFSFDKDEKLRFYPKQNKHKNS